MTKHLRRSPLLFAACCACLCLLAASLPHPAAAAAQFRKREYLTPHEIEAVRFAQELDKRTSLFVRVIERRLKLLAGGVEPAAPAKSEPAATELEGARPSDVLTRTRPQLLSDIALALDEAIENIDDVATRAPESSLIGKSTKRLAEAAQKFLPQLMPLRATITDGPERESLEQALDNLQQIIDAVKKVKDEPAEDKSKKKP